MWERIKAEEKAEKRARRSAKGLPPEDHGKGFLDGVPVAHTALTRALKLQEKAAKVGFDWGEAGPVLDKIEEEIGELRAAIQAGGKTETEDELGDLFFAMVNLARHLKIDPENALRGTNEKFRKRFHSVEDALVQNGSSLDSASLDEMEALWQAAKSKA
jgi:ATP diphosphatase